MSVFGILKEYMTLFLSLLILVLNKHNKSTDTRIMKLIHVYIPCIIQISQWLKEGCLEPYIVCSNQQAMVHITQT